MTLRRDAPASQLSVADLPRCFPQITLKNPQSNAGAAIRRAPLLPPRHMQSLAKADGSEYEHAAYLTSRQAQRYQF